MLQEMFSAWLRAVHAGRIGGAAYRTLWIGAGLTIAVASATGVLIWSFERWALAAISDASYRS